MGHPNNNIVISQYCYEDTFGKLAFMVLCTLMLWRTMVSNILFRNPKPIIDIPPIHVTTEFVTFLKFSGVWLCYINLVDDSWKGFRERITKVASVQGMAMGNTKPFSSRWRDIRLISVSRIPWSALMDLEISSTKQQ